MKVFKFGGASVKDARGIQNVVRILNHFRGEEIVVVVSAMGKTTNALEILAQKAWHAADYKTELEHLKTLHHEVLEQLKIEQNSFLNVELEALNQVLTKVATFQNFNAFYDAVVSMGEILSSKILSAYLNKEGLSNEWLDARKLIKTSSLHREAEIDWNPTRQNLKKAVQNSEKKLWVIPGFIGSDAQENPTTLGREGSDFSGAIIAHCLDAQSLSIWKDVPGILNADPRIFPSAQKIEKLSYREAAEMTYYGAQVIHPKTIKPLAEKGIPLLVRPFESPEQAGTQIGFEQVENIPPVFIYKFNQTLVSLHPKDYSFINEQNLSLIFKELAARHIHLNLMQNSALSFSICFDSDKDKFEGFIQNLSNLFDYRYNDGLQLLTIKHYSEALLEQYRQGKEVIIEQKTRGTFQVLYK